ncbi:hypothetical protein [Bacterioplanoides sp. SCSIO 12839]|uniref:hypothetical protein n=1 Tax=Bacterioplanoides sp. SCSIO 12839 TaxID=2829569 RepID=UPI0022080A73|nr:hypothetical protein KFF03_09870 [Bacterioplanoides sp. SCSIO 12839]
MRYPPSAGSSKKSSQDLELLRNEVNQAFDKLDASKASFIEHDDAKEKMPDYKARIRKNY